MDAGATRRECATDLHLGQTLVSTFIKLSDLAPEIRHLVAWGRSSDVTIAFSAAVQLTRLRYGTDQIALANDVLLYGLTSNEVVQIVQKRERSSSSLARCVQEVLRLRPQIEVRHLFIGSISSGAVRERLGKISQTEKDKVFERALDAVFDRKLSASGRLGVSYFTIVASQDLPVALRLDPDDLERMINESLFQVR